MSKKILIATGVYPPESGGPATYTKLLEGQLPPLGFEVEVLPFARVRHLPKIVRHAAYFFVCMRIARAVDVVYAQDPVSVGLPAWLAAALVRKKFMVRLGGDYAWEQARQRFGVTDDLDIFQTKSYGLGVEVLRMVQRFVVRHAKAVVVPSEYMKKVVDAWTDPAKVHRIYTSIALPPSYTELESRPEEFLVVSFGRNVPWKGFDALRAVVAREPRWTLKIFHDLPHKEAMGWLKAADVYVNNSTYEGLSHQLVEAMALGTPVVATDAGGNREVVGDAGLIVAQGDNDALYSAIKSVHDDRVGASARTAQALSRAKMFSIDIAVHQLAGLVDTVCES